MNPIFSFVMIQVGAFVFWIVKGVRGRFSDETSGVYDNDFKYWRNLITGGLVIVIIAVVIGNRFNNYLSQMV